MFSFLIIITINILIYIFNKSIAQGINLFDNPDKFRKFHKEKVPLTGGIIIFLNSSLALIFTLAEYLYFDKSIIFKNDLDLIILFISIFTIFFVGFVDDNTIFLQTKDFYLLR